ncbi:MAG: nucleotidyltransferase domain-containing protein [Bacteroidetes bacterium]|nr:MAG: nucleotidyltransferase domain-containing protein [Bacteroidota bacterium]RLD84232.1 MAG: nucleotidyltransferase domain-containing protein [Bacteroidota bacterium]
MISKNQIDRIKQILVKIEKPQMIYLFGSYAYGKPNESSDIDILVINDYNLPRRKRGLQARKELAKLRLPIDIIFYTPDEVNKYNDASLAFITSITQKGRKLYEQPTVE